MYSGVAEEAFQPAVGVRGGVTVRCWSFHFVATFWKISSDIRHDVNSITMEPRFYDRRSNDILDLTINILCPGKSYNKLYGAESRFNNIQFNDISGITMEI